MENPPIFKKGKPSISMAHLYHGKLLNNQRVYHIISAWWFGCKYPIGWSISHRMINKIWDVMMLFHCRCKYITAWWFGTWCFDFPSYIMYHVSFLIYHISYIISYHIILYSFIFHDIPKIHVSTLGLLVTSLAALGALVELTENVCWTDVRIGALWLSIAWGYNFNNNIVYLWFKNNLW